MKNFLQKTVRLIPTLLLIAIFMLSLLKLIDTRFTQLAEEVREKETVTATAEIFDTSVLENWCGGPEGTIRLVTGCKISEAGKFMELEDETGNIWEVENRAEIEYGDFLLMWIADNNTPDNIYDDIMVDLWKETWD